MCGWVNALRLQRAIQFVIVRDPSGLVQVTHKRGGDGDEIEQAIESLSEESAVAVTGTVVENPIVNLGGLEIIPERVEILGKAESPLPIDEHSGPEHRLDWRFLDVRKRPVARQVFEIQTTMEQAFREYAYSQGFAYYVNAFRYGCPPHGGLGMGLSRMLMVLLGLDSIRDATFLFRGPSRLTP